jgi:hypothetical protein
VCVWERRNAAVSIHAMVRDGTGRAAGVEGGVRDGDCVVWGVYSTVVCPPGGGGAQC